MKLITFMALFSTLTMAGPSMGFIKKFSSIKQKFGITEDQVIDMIYSNGDAFTTGENGEECAAEILMAQINEGISNRANNGFVVDFSSLQIQENEKNCSRDINFCQAIFIDNKIGNKDSYSRWKVMINCDSGI